MTADFTYPMIEKEIEAILDYYKIDLSELAVFIDDGFEWLASNTEKYGMAYIVNPVYTLDIREDKVRYHSKYTYEDSDFIIDVLDDEGIQQFDYRTDFLNKLGRQFIILGPHKKQEDFTIEDSLKFDRIIESNIDGRCWYLRIKECYLQNEG